MSIGLFCSICKKSSKLGSKKCNCGNNFKNNRKYRVRYKMPNGKWKSRIVDTLDLARSLEGQYRTDKIKEKDFGIHKAPKIEDVWKKYIAWAKVNKRSWRDDKARWEMHVAQHVKKKPMNRITLRHIENILEDMRSRKNPKGKPYAPATIKQVLVLIKRVYNWAIKSELYNGFNPATKVALQRQLLFFDNFFQSLFAMR
jgi:hypothetical protein